MNPLSIFSNNILKRSDAVLSLIPASGFTGINSGGNPFLLQNLRIRDAFWVVFL
jgi:hypothetical protein